MTDMSQKFRFGSPFLSDAAPSLAEVLERLEQRGELTPTQYRDLRSAIRSLCRLLERRPEEMPANINWLHVRLRRVHPAAHDISMKRFASIKSGVLKALALTGCSRDRAAWLRPPSPAWKTLLTTLPDKHDRWKLSQFAQYCTANDVPPTEVSDEQVLGLIDTLVAESFVKSPDKVAVNAVKTWNRLRTEIPGWPDITLSRLPYRRERWTFDLDHFPKSLRDDIQCWHNRLAEVVAFKSRHQHNRLNPEL